MRSTAALTASVVVILSGFSADAATQSERNRAGQGSRVGTHCKAPETVGYSCRMGARTVSVCISDLGPIYRSGPLGRPELVISGKDRVTLGVLRSQGAWQTQLRFANGNYSYVVFDIEFRNGRESGVHVWKGDEMVTTLACRMRGPQQRLGWTAWQAGLTPETDDRYLVY